MIKNNTNYNIILLSQTKKSNTLNNVLTFEWYVNNSTDQGFEKLILSIGNNESTDNGNLSASLQCVAALWNRVLTAGHKRVNQHSLLY